MSDCDAHLGSHRFRFLCWGRIKEGDNEIIKNSLLGKLESDRNGNGNLQAAIEDVVEKIFFVSFKDRQRSGWSPVACLSLCLFPSPSSLSLAGVVLHPDLLSHYPLDGAYEQRGPVEKPTKLILLWEEQTSI